MKRIYNCIALTLLSLMSITTYALPLAINPQPGTLLPDQFIVGGGVDSALYIVSNNTTGVRNNNYVAYMPRNVTQITSNSNVSSLCMPTFNLQPRGHSGDRCALELAVFGQVNGNDPNRFQHLFVCLSDRTTCVGPVEQLNVNSTNAVAVGEYSTDDNPSLPFLIIINNNSWQFVDVTNVDNIPDFGPFTNQLASASCANDSCIVGGSFSDDFANLFPLLLVSRSNGMSWTFIDTNTIQGTPNFGAVNEINKVRCANAACIAAGVFQNANQTINLPFLLSSQNQGLSWSFIDPTTVRNAPTFAPLCNTFFGGDCFGMTCVAVGSFGTGSSNGGTSRSNITANPLLFTSNNGGRTFESINVSAIPGVPSFGTNNANELIAASCNNNACVAVGNFATADNLFILPLILVSDKQGKNWSFIDPATIANIPPNTFVGDNELTNVSCSNTVCVATGYYSVPNTGDLFPLLLVSNNNGRSWRFIDATSLQGTPSFGSFNPLYSASCSGNICSASGNYSTTAVTPVFLPLLFQSKDAGSTWSYIDTTTANGVPLYGNYNNFFDTTCFGTNVCTVAGNFMTSTITPLSLLTNAANNNLRGRAWSNLSTATIKDYPAVTSGTINELATTS